MSAEVVSADGIEADHRVVVFGVPDDPEELVQLVAALPGMDRFSANYVVRSLPRIIPYALDRDSAAQAASQIRDLGLTATAIPASEVPALLHAKHVHHLRVSDETLESIETEGEPHSWPWDAVTAISVGVVPSTAPNHQRPAPAAASGSSHRSWNDGARIPSKHRPEVFLVLNDGQESLRFASDEMNYEYLGERLSTSSSANFKLLVRDLVSHADKAWITPSTRAFLDRGPMRHYEFRSRDDFCHYTEFQALLGRQMTSNRPG
jgi:hypothetical protein